MQSNNHQRPATLANLLCTSLQNCWSASASSASFAFEEADADFLSLSSLSMSSGGRFSCSCKERNFVAFLVVPFLVDVLK
jgi:hypothetical protein